MCDALQEDVAYVDGATQLASTREEALSVEPEVEQARCDLENFDVGIFERSPCLFGRRSKDAQRADASSVAFGEKSAPEATAA